MEASKQVETQVVLNKLSNFVINSSGDSDVIFDLTLQAAEQTFPFLLNFIDVMGVNSTPITFAEALVVDDFGTKAATALSLLFEHYGSDKTWHKYHHVYGSILKYPDVIEHVLEIGLGTNNEDVPSSMGAQGKPCASIKAFRDFLPNAQIYGADIDTRILIENEERITTFFVDQTKPETLKELGDKTNVAFDLIIDDGLHSPNANIAVMTFALPKLKVGGFLVIEDIHHHHYPIWAVIGTLLPKNYRAQLVNAHNGILFVVEKLQG